ncbi:MAG: acyl-CoA synthetase [Rhodospirillales bacterium]|nr:acyl-CoA synthetase [Rhodospirillales bacterium]
MDNAPRTAVVLARRVQEGHAEFDLLVPPDLFWFRGHFEAFPILPGVVQIDWAMAFARQYLGLELVAAQRFQVKFASPIGPGDTLVLALRHQCERHRLSFEYRRNGKMCSTGQVTVAP